MSQSAIDGTLDMFAYDIMDDAEQNENLLEAKQALRKLDQSLRDMISAEAWDLIIKREEKEADYRLQLVKNVIEMTVDLQSGAENDVANACEA